MTLAQHLLDLKLRLTGAPTSGASGPNFAFVDDKGCLVCPHQASLPSMAPYWEDAIKGSPSTPSSGSS